MYGIEMGNKGTRIRKRSPLGKIKNHNGKGCVAMGMYSIISTCAHFRLLNCTYGSYLNIL